MQIALFFQQAFKTLIEGKSEDGETNTVPEMIDAMKGINSEETTVKEEIEVTEVEHVSPEDLTDFQV